MSDVILRFRNYYRCDHKDSLEEGQTPCDWYDEWECMCNDRCPVCNHEISPEESEELYDEYYIVGDQPTVCPKCGSRTEYETWVRGNQYHTCLGCGLKFIAEPNPEDEEIPYV